MGVSSQVVANEIKVRIVLRKNTFVFDKNRFRWRYVIAIGYSDRTIFRYRICSTFDILLQNRSQSQRSPPRCLWIFFPASILIRPGNRKRVLGAISLRWNKFKAKLMQFCYWFHWFWYYLDEINSDFSSSNWTVFFHDFVLKTFQ